MGNLDAIRAAFAAAVDSAQVDPSAPQKRVDERVRFDPGLLASAMRLLAGPADREMAIASLDALMHEAIDRLDVDRGLASLKLLEKLEAAGERRLFRDGPQGLEPLR